MKILFIDHYPAPHLGGGEEYLLTAAAGLKKLGFEVAVLALSNSGLAHASRTAGIKTYEANFFSKNIFKDRSAVSEVIEQFKPDIINTHGYYSGIVVRLAAARTGNVPVVNTVHTEVRPLNGGLSRTIRNLVEKQTSKNVYYIAVSHTVARQLQDIGISKEKISVIHPAYDPSVEPFSKKSGGVFTFGAAGRLERVKGFHLLIQAFARAVNQCGDVRLVIRGEGNQRQKLEKLIHRLGIENRVLLPGYVTERNRIYEGFDVFISSSLLEGFSITLLNAAVSGVPCICTDAGGQTEIIEHKRTGLVVPAGDENALADSLVYAYRHYDEMLTMAELARDSLLERFSPHVLVNKHAELFTGLLQRQ